MISEFVKFEQDSLAVSKKKIITIYEKLLSQIKSAEIKDFFMSVSYVTVGTVIEAISWFIFNILAGRYLGPDEYGKFTLIYSIGTFLYLPMTLGITTGLIKYSSEKSDFDRRSSIITTSYIIVLTLSISFICIYIKFSETFEKLFSIPQDIFNLGIIFAFIYAFYIITTSTLQGIFQIKKYAILKPVCSFILLASFLTFVLNEKISFKSPIFSVYVAYLITGCIILFSIQKYLRAQFLDRQWTKTLLKYGFFSFLCAVSYIICSTIDQIFINKYLNIEAVGLYNAYYISSLKVMSMISGILVTIMFPLISGHEEKNSVLKKYRSFIPYIVFLGIPLMAISQIITLKLYGDNFELNLTLVLIFSITSVLFLCYDIYGWIFNSIGINGAKLTMYGTITMGIVNLILDIYLIPLLGLKGSIIATALAYCAGLTVLYIKRPYKTYTLTQL